MDAIEKDFLKAFEINSVALRYPNKYEVAPEITQFKLLCLTFLCCQYDIPILCNFYYLPAMRNLVVQNLYTEYKETRNPEARQKLKAEVQAIIAKEE